MQTPHSTPEVLPPCTASLGMLNGQSYIQFGGLVAAVGRRKKRWDGWHVAVARILILIFILRIAAKKSIAIPLSSNKKKKKLLAARRNLVCHT